MKKCVYLLKYQLISYKKSNTRMKYLLKQRNMRIMFAVTHGEDVIKVCYKNECN